MNEKQNEPKLTYAIDASGKMVYIRNVVKRGLDCNCRCPKCKEQLVAKLGHEGGRQPHFAHQKDADCHGSYMTALHMLAQQIIEEEKAIMLPDYIGLYYEKKTNSISFNKVTLEETIKTKEGEIRPDCVGYIIGKDNKEYRFLIEIFVTHSVGEIKRKAIQSSNEYCIEIDLSDLIDTDYTREKIADRLKEYKNDRKWINCPVFDELEKKKLEEAEKIRINQEMEEYERRKEEDLKRKRIQDQVMKWYSGDNPDIAALIQNDISRHPYVKNDGKANSLNPLFEVLLPHNDFLYFIDQSPKNDISLELFYTLLYFYYLQTRKIDFGELENKLRYFKLRHDILSEEDKIQLEELISLRIVYILVRQREELYPTYGDEVYVYDNAIKKYTAEAELRKQILMASSIIYHHIVGSNTMDFDELTREIMSNYPWLAKSFRRMVYNQQKYLKYFFHEATLEELTSFVKNQQCDEDGNIDDYLKECYSFAFDGKIKYKKYINDPYQKAHRTFY